MASSKSILVVGATGQVGRAVAHQLQRDGFAVRIFTRSSSAAQRHFDPRYSLFQGDLDDETALDRALAGCDGVHLSLPSGHDPAQLERVQHQGAARIARLAAKRGIAHLTFVSGYLVSEHFAQIPAERAKLRAEEAVRTSGVPYTLFRPTYFTDLLPRFIQGQRASIFGKQPHPIRFLALCDFARMVSLAHSTAATNQALFVCGPEALTFEEALRMVLSVKAPGVAVSHAPFWMMKLMNRLFLKGEITEILQLMEATERVGEIGDPSEAIRLFGAAPTTVRQWAMTIMQ